MTKVSIGYNRISVTGHSGQSDVCTACSTLLCTLIHNMEIMKDSGLVIFLRTSIDEQAADTHIEFTPCPGHESDVELVVYAVTNGYRLLAINYPDFVSVSETA